MIISDNKGNTTDEKEVNSMSTITMERNGYKRLNFAGLNFADEKNIDYENMEEITPIRWSKDVLSGEKQVIIKKR